MSVLRGFRLTPGALATLAFAALLGCGTKEPPRPFIPPLPPPSAVLEPPHELPEPPVLMAWAIAEVVMLPPFVVEEPIQPSAPPPPPPQPPKSPAPAAPDVPPPKPPPPQLAELLTDEQQRTYQQEYNDAMRDVDAVLGAVRNRVLTREQAAIQERVRSFAEQARAQHDADLATARNLATRARILAGELQRSLP
jgi:hypothetical protein